MQKVNKTILITGCSSGFGKLAAKTFWDRGWNVVATMRTPEKETELTQLKGLLVTRLDVMDLESIRQAVDAAMERFDSIDVLVNNAGYGGHALFEQMSDDGIRRMFDTNVFGVMNMTRAVLPVMRRQKEGIIINVTSMAGMMGLPTVSIYASTKFAVEGLSEAMALEYRPLNISVKTVVPGAYPTTRFHENTDDNLNAGGEELASFAKNLYAQLAVLAQSMSVQGGKEADPQEVADKIYECATTETPVRNPVGADAEMFVEKMSRGSRQEFLNNLAGVVLPTEETS